MVEVTPNDMVDTAHTFVMKTVEEKEGKLLSTKIKVIEKGEKHKGAFEAGKATFADKHAILAKIASIFGVKLAKTDEVSVAKALLAFTRDNRDSLDAPHRQYIVDIIDTFKSPGQAETFKKIRAKILEVKVTGVPTASRKFLPSTSKPTRRQSTGDLEKGLPEGKPSAKRVVSAPGSISSQAKPLQAKVPPPVPPRPPKVQSAPEKINPPTERSKSLYDKPFGPPPPPRENPTVEGQEISMPDEPPPPVKERPKSAYDKRGSTDEPLKPLKKKRVDRTNPPPAQNPPSAPPPPPVFIPPVK